MTAHAPLPWRRSTIILNRPRGAALTAPVSLPAAPARFADILPAVRAIADAFQSEAHQAMAGLDQPVTCSCGCDACCRHLVMLGETEALALLRTLRTLPEDHQNRVRARFRAGLERLEAAGLTPDLYATFTREVHNQRRLGEMQTAYWELQIPCPFLEDGSCGIYAERPLICRQYAMTSPPAACRTPFSAGTTMVKVLPPYDLAGAAAAFDGQQAHASRALPLLFCLLRESHLNRRVFPVLEPEPMLARFLEFAAEHYARADQPPYDKERP
ncbi:MAG: YkgJ family cysteine cluster protein [Humidesulfovibrio sp.]|nr:YkgJ family cysteine cluster protein [Humidesulfovibrio sp.]